MVFGQFVQGYLVGFSTTLLMFLVYLFEMKRNREREETLHANITDAMERLQNERTKETSQ